MTVRQLWAMARGKADAEAENRAWLLAQFGVAITPEQADALNPFRLAEKVPPTPAEEADESRAAFDLLGLALKAQREQHHP